MGVYLWDSSDASADDEESTAGSFQYGHAKRLGETAVEEQRPTAENVALWFG